MMALYDQFNFKNGMELDYSQVQYNFAHNFM